MTKPTAISLFSGALGLDLGIERAGFEIRVAVECNRFAAETIRLNRPEVPLIQRPIETVKTEELLRVAGLKRGEPTVVTGGPSCQAFSTAGPRASVADPRGAMFRQFIRVVREAQPRFFVMENVRGVLSAAIKHRPLNERGPGHPPLHPDEELGSALRLILQEFRALGYYVVFGLVNAADFGVAQTRERVLFIGSRDAQSVRIPERTHAKHASDGRLPWLSLRRALHGLKDPDPVFTTLPKAKRRYLARIPEGGNWRDLPPRLQANALGGAFTSWGGRTGFLRRLAWNRPAPALTSRPDSSATMLCHPTELRPLSVLEYACLQGFPDDWELAGGPPQQYRQIGNAVPVRLGFEIGQSIRSAMRRRPDPQLQGLIVCSDENLLQRLARRPVTVLNPPRMRKHGNLDAARRWLRGARRESILDYVTRTGTD